MRVGYLAALLLCFFLMVGLGSVPGEANALSDRYGDKLLHVLAYGAMAVLCFQVPRASPEARAAVTIGMISLLGLADEALQSLLPYRNASLQDWWFDIGTAAVVAFLLMLYARNNQPTDSHEKN